MRNLFVVLVAVLMLPTAMAGGGQDEGGPIAGSGHMAIDFVLQGTPDAPVGILENGGTATAYYGSVVFGPGAKSVVASQFNDYAAVLESLGTGRDKLRGEVPAPVPVNELTAEWKDGFGVTHKIRTIQGINEKDSDYRKRHTTSVRALVKDFPPAP